MNIYFDYQIFYLQNQGGISRYFAELNNELLKIENSHSKIIAPCNHNLYLKNKSKKEVYQLNQGIQDFLYHKNINKARQINTLLTDYFLKKNKNGIIHETYYSQRSNALLKNRVITIHDMIPEIYLRHTSQGEILIEQKKKAIEQAALIITVSENTKKDLLKLYPSVKNKTQTIYHGVSDIESKNTITYKHPKPFILFVGHRGDYKNFKTLLYAFANDTSLNTDFDLVCLGGDKFNVDEQTEIKNLGVENKVTRMQGDDNLLYSLYKTALCFVYPSLYEGFGMPVLEAMKAGCPVICANTSSLPEVANDAALYINPENADDIKRVLNSIAQDDNYRKLYIEKGLANANLFSWKTCADKTYNAYKTFQ